MTSSTEPTVPTDPFHDFSLPQDADLVSSPTPNAEDAGAGSNDDDDPVGESDD